MVLPIFDQIQLGLEFSMGSFVFIFFTLMFCGILFLSASGWTVPLGAILVFGGVLMSAWAGYAVYGTIGVALLVISYILIVSAYALIRR